MIQLIFSYRGKSFFIFILSLAIAFQASGSEYVTVMPKNGEAVMTIFKKYKITPNATNISYFKEINKIKKLNKLLIGKNYKLPILKVPFDGKSIASSIPHLGKSAARNVMDYNNVLYKKQLRKKPYAKNKIVWIVYDEWNQNRSRNTENEVGLKKISVSTKSRIPKAYKLPTESIAAEISRIKNISSPELSRVKATNSAPEKAEATRELVTEANDSKNISVAAGSLSTANIRTRVVPIFGSDFQEIRIESEELKDKVYYLVSGHGGPDPGTMFHGDDHILCEDEYAYDVTLRLARKLMEQGAKVYLIVQDPNDGIRDEKYLKIDYDEKCISGYPLVLNQKLRLTQTTDAVNDLYRANRKKGVSERDQLAIHIHVDSRQKDMRKDVFFYYQENNRNSEEMARNIKQTLEKKYQEHSGREYTGTVSSRNLFVMRNTIPSTVYMELGNLQNDDDQKRLLFPSNRQALAEWLYDGIIGE